GVQIASARAAGTPARILACRFLGEVDHLDLAVDGLDRPVKARRRGPGPSRPGEDVALTLALGDVLVFPKAGGGPISTE
ncbi:hypothetical protein J8J40_32550, partial [Mycobacterium tuberculosis]|nr:hypothetical protein [Mycobacterium tuberculosis]